MSVVRSIVAVMLLGPLVGCGGSDEVELGTVSGVVTLDGAPLRGVFVTFQPQGFPPSSGVTNREGRYELNYVGDKGAVVGEHEVFLDELLSDEVADYQADIGGRPSKVPEEFRQPFQKLEVKPGHNELDLVLTSDE